MKILLYTDVHLSTNSSIIRRRGKVYSERLENVINSVNWAENKALELHCDEVICLGDFFDKPILTDEEITAITAIQWAKIPHTFIVGNHESSVNGLRYNSVKCLEALGFNIVDTPSIRKVDDKTDFVFLPYITEDNRKRLESYMDFGVNNIVFSHNDIKGIQYGKIESPNGFPLADIEKDCKLFLNGHLHNGSFLNSKKTILNLGNLTGQNFGEDASTYKHSIAILDTDTLEISFIENPYAFNFYKLEVDDNTDIDTLLSKLKNNSVVSFKCLNTRENELKTKLSEINNVCNYKIVLYSETLDSDDNIVLDNLATVDHLKQFKEFILEQLGTSKTVLEELCEICQ